ncbi:MAG: DUF2309 domain-containing protein [Planctomycetia bacterium]|nr:DUF2309 domain-containing protein [Planctomycetia bacterium]
MDKSPHPEAAASGPAADDRTASIQRAIDHAAHYLPAQGPIGVFIHHNTLHAFEEEPFEEAVVHASRVFEAEPFLAESRYREEMARGRIRTTDVEAVIDRELVGLDGQRLAAGRVSLRDLHLALMLHPVRQESDDAVRWTLTEGDLIERLRPDLPPEVRWRLVSDGGAGDDAAGAGAMADVEDEAARRATFARTAAADMADGERRASSELWHACVEAVALTRPAVVHVRPPVRHRDLILAVDPALDTDALLHPLLIRLCAAFLDQGVASWPMPGRERGLLAAAVALYSAPLGPTEPWSARLPAALAEIRGKPAVQVVADELDRLGIPAGEREEHILRSLLALRGWAGMIRHLEERPDRAPVVPVPARLADFLALRLVCDRVATQWAAQRLGHRSGGRGATAGPLPGLWVELRDRFPPRRGPGSLARAFLMHQVAQLVGLTARDIQSLDDNELLRFEGAIASFDQVTRRRLFHLAYERRHRIEVLDALAAHDRVSAPPPRSRPLVQAIFCIDERCESFRRHFEELGPRYETFGTAGFFAVPMYYRGLDDWHASPLCPIVMRPQRTVVEVPEEEAVAHHVRWRSLRRLIGRLSGSLSASSRTIFRGGLFTAFGGAIAAVPLVARVAFPRLSARLGRRAAEIARRRIPTRLALDAEGPGGVDAAAAVAGTRVGFDAAEMAAMVRRVLEDVGLRDRFARIVAVIGHGSSSRNNPHESAYDCGACGGGRGGPNARAFATMANDPRVRERLAAEGLSIPEDTRFIGGMLDTCSDTVEWYDVDRLSPDHGRDIDLLREACGRVASANAHERCRRFETAPLDIDPVHAHEHVEARSVDLAQVRPELGHATNAVCVIGRRWRTRGLFLDRRAFLVSYDPTTDPDGSILARTLAAVGPVGAGINLEYYFSIVDRLGYGSGTKLPHNITGLIGVMDGHASDLRTGLPWQMVEIHEPVRLLIVIEATPARILAAAEGVPAVKRLVDNRWVQLASWDPDTGGLAVLEDGRFVPHVPERADVPVVERSIAWYSGRRDHLPPARLLAAMAGEPPVFVNGRSA